MPQRDRDRCDADRCDAYWWEEDRWEADRWDADRARRLFASTFPGTSLVVVSNREPYVHVRRGSELRVDRPAGGLTAALDPLLQGIGGTWVAWGSGSGDRLAVPDGILLVPPGDPRYHLRRVWLDPAEVKGFYEGYSNMVLWPLCHMMIERVDLKAASWPHYARVNRRFADQAAATAPPGSLVWVHDYQLALAPLFLRSQRPDCLIASFWHIPWPPHAVFRFCPHGSQIIKGLLGCDLIGFQTEDYARNFLECAERHLGVPCQVKRDASVMGTQSWEERWQVGEVSWQGRRSAVGVFPISIDYEEFAAQALAPESLRAARRTLNRLGVRSRASAECGDASGQDAPGTRLRIGIAVDRLDYTKGIKERLAALDQFFTANPHYRERVSLV